MNLPKLHYISQGKTLREQLENIQSACASGAELVQLRIKNASKLDILKTAKEARDITGHFQTRLIINDYYKIAKEVKADGVHLGKTDASPEEARTHLASWQIIGGTANSIQDCKTLISQQVDYIGLGPYKYTNTKENLSPIIGLNGYLKILTELKTKLPIIAIGGITLNDVDRILETGIYGIAASGEITKNFKTISSFHKLLRKDSAREEQIWTPNQNK